MASKNKVSLKEIQSMKLPQVTFDSQELMAKIGEWTGILYDSEMQDYCNKRNRHNPFIRVYFPKPVVDRIKLEFQYVLLCAGIDKDEECTLGQLDDNNFSFKCHLKKANKDLDISLRWETLDDLGQITVEDDTRKATYEHLFYRNEKMSEVKPYYYSLKNGNTSCFRLLSGRNAEYTLRDQDNHSLKISVGRPDWITEPIYDYQYRLKNEKELENYLLGLTFPIDISEVYKKLISISLGKAADYPGITLEAKKGDDVPTDKIALSYGKLLEFMITKGGKRVQFDKDGNWKFDTDDVSVETSQDGSVSYNMRATSYDELLKCFSQNQFSDVQKEVESVKQYSKTIFN